MKQYIKPMGYRISGGLHRFAGKKTILFIQVCGKMIRAIETSADHPEEMVREMHKCKHVFRTKELDFQFGVCEETNLPLLTKTALDFPSAVKSFLGFYSDPSARRLDAVHKIFKKHKSRVLDAWSNLPKQSELDAIKLLAMETVAHDFRYRATIEPDKTERTQLFETAFQIYEFVLLSWCQTGITDILRCKMRMRTKTSHVSAPPDMSKFDQVQLRNISHSFAGLAVCALLGQRSPGLFFSLSTAALAWNPEEALLLGSVLRFLLLATGTYDMKLKSISLPKSEAGTGWEFTVNTMDALDELMGFTSSTMIQLPAIYDRMTKEIMLPLVMRAGTPEMLRQERALLPPSAWVDAHRFALNINKRFEDLSTGKIPAPKAITHTHIVNARFAERVCGSCGKWEQQSDVKFLRCSRCMFAYYCGRDCQVADWKRHRETCKPSCCV